jgi:hypothetical protein
MTSDNDYPFWNFVIAGENVLVFKSEAMYMFSMATGAITFTASLPWVVYPWIVPERHSVLDRQGHTDRLRRVDATGAVCPHVGKLHHVYDVWNNKTFRRLARVARG